MVGFIMLKIILILSSVLAKTIVIVLIRDVWYGQIDIFLIEFVVPAKAVLSLISLIHL